MVMNRRQFALAGLSVAASVVALPAWSQSADAAFPTKPVTLVVPYAAGGLTDILGRIVAPRLADKWGKNVLVDNKPGGGTTMSDSLSSGLCVRAIVVLATWVSRAVVDRLLWPSSTWMMRISTPLSSSVALACVVHGQSRSRVAFKRMSDMEVCAKQL